MDSYSRRQATKDVGGFSLGTIVISFVVLLVMVIVGAMWIFGFGLFQRSTADFRGETAEREQVFADANYRIASYDKFFDICASVQSKEDQISNLEMELDLTTPSASREERIYSSITALRNSRAELIRGYNADASKTDTRANFLASNLPFNLNTNTEETTCAA